MKKLVKKNGFQIVQKAPDAVITVGGDGSILFSERAFPGVPKLCFRYSKVCARCSNTGSKHLQMFFCGKCVVKAVRKLSESKKIVVKLERKLEGTAITRRGVRKKLLALNEVQVHNNSPLHAVRGSVFVNGKRKAEFIGDGVIVATPYGSTGYFNAVTRKTFSHGIGVAFNNPTKPIKPLFLKNSDKVRIILSRRHGLMVADNDADTTLLDTGDSVTVKYSNECAKFIQL